MSARITQWLLVVILASSATLAIETETVIDEASIIAEMDRLIDETPPIDEKARERVRELVARGIEAHDRHEYERAIEYYEKARAIDPIDPVIHYELAFSTRMLGKMERALEAVVRAIAVDPKNDVFYAFKASILDDLGHTDLAIAEYRRLLDIKPDSYMANINLGITMYNEREYAEAETLFKKAAESDPRQSSPYFNLWRLYNAQGFNYDEERVIEKFLEMSPEGPRADAVRQRQKEMTGTELGVAGTDPASMVRLTEDLIHVAWRTAKHREAHPDARGYRPTYEEYDEALRAAIESWRDYKAKDPSLSNGRYDLLERIEGAAFLDVFIWLTRKNEIGRTAEDWIQAHPERVQAFKAWAAANDIRLVERGPDDLAREGEARIEKARELPGQLFDVAAESSVKYVLHGLGGESEREEILEEERRRFRRKFEFEGTRRFRCGDALENARNRFDVEGSRAVLPVLLCFDASAREFEQAEAMMSRAGRHIDDIRFRPRGSYRKTREGFEVFADDHPAWLLYAHAKAVWSGEDELRTLVSGGGDPGTPSIEQEMLALTALAGGYVNSRSEEDAAAEPERQPSPLLDRVEQVVRADMLRGFTLYEVVHQYYGVKLDRLSDEEYDAVADYVSRFVYKDLVPEGSTD